MSATPVAINVKLNARLQPEHRLQLFEDPLDAMLEGAGIGYTFEQDILPDIDTGRVIRILEAWTPPYPGLCLYYPGRRNLSAGVRAFLDLAREFSRNGKE